MFKKIVIGDDGLDGGRDAVALAKALAPGAELLLATAYPWDPTPSRFTQLGYGNILRDDAEQALAARREQAGVPAARLVTIPDSSPARALHRLAEDEHADLIVVGSARHGTLGRMLLGDVSRDVLHGSPCPVAVAPLGRDCPPPRTIGIAYDHSPEAERALTAGIRLAEELGAAVEVREVVASDLLPAVGGYALSGMEDIERELVADAQARLDAMVGCLKTTAAVTARAVSGAVHQRIEELAADVDLLVCGSRGWGAVRRVVLGSTANRLVHHAACPVLVITRGPEAETPDEADVGAQRATA
jgi:nucleotide-binding universal stress UspA family protein